MGAGVEFAGAWGSVALILDRDFKFRRLDVDGLDGLTDDTSNGIEHLTSGLQLTFLEGLMKQLGPHVLQTSEHIVAISLPVFINEQLYFAPIAPSGFN